MDTSIVKLSLLDANGKQRNTTWRTGCDYVKCLADAAEEGCRRLGIDNTFNIVILDQTNVANEEEKLPDDVLEPKKMYFIVDRRIFDNTSTSSVATAPSSSTASISPLRQLRTRPVFQPSSSNTSLSLQPASTRTSSPSRIIGRFSSFSMDGSATPETSSTSSTPQPSSSTPSCSYDTHLQPSRRQQMSQFFVDKEKSVNATYASYAHLKPLIFFKIDLFDFFNEKSLAKCAVVLLHSKADPRLNEAARYTLCFELKQLLKEVRPTFDIAHAELAVLPSLINKLTSTQLFLDLTLDNHQGIIDRYVQRQRRLLPSKSPRLKRKHPVHLEENLDEASSSILQIEDASTLHSLYESTSAIRSAWLRQLWNDPSFDRGMVTYYLSKFPQIKTDLSLIHYDFVNLTTSKRKNPNDLAVKFRQAVPQIYECAANSDVVVPVYQGLYDKEFQAGRILCELILRQMKARQCNYNRLLINCTETSEYHEGLRQMNDMGITAPVIVALGTHPETTFFIAVDGIALKVNGHFADALQSFMEVIFVFNRSYDPETINIVYLFEVLMGFSANSSPRRQNLINTLYPATTTTMEETVRQEESSNDGHDLNTPSAFLSTRQFSRKRRQPSTISLSRQPSLE